MQDNTIFASKIRPCSTSQKVTRIVSLWDMLQIDTKSFLAGLTFLGGALSEFKLFLQFHSTGHAMVPILSVENRDQVLFTLDRFRSNCALLGLNISESFAQSARAICFDALAGDDWSHPYNLQQVVIALEMLLNATVAEAASRKFYVLGGDVQEKHDDADALFGVEVVDRFPHAAFDISEAGKCMSFGLWTACVMHTMRVLETGLHALAIFHGVAVSDNWNKTLNDIEAELRGIRKTTDGSGAEQWAAEAGTHLRFIKNAWRNQAMHPHSKYDESDAKVIFVNARSFMQHLASRLPDAI